MRYYKMISGGYITIVGIGAGGEEIAADEYNSIRAIIGAKPVAPEGFDYRLTDALVWEQYELPPVSAEPTLWTQETLAGRTNAELEQLLNGYGISGSMNKENMIRIILLAQGGTVT